MEAEELDKKEVIAVIALLDDDFPLSRVVGKDGADDEAYGGPVQPTLHL